MTERQSVSKITYLAGDKETKTPSAEATVIRTTFANGNVQDFDFAKTSPEVQKQAMLQGFSIKLQRSFASAKGKVEDAIEMYETVAENLLNGIWATKREGSGPRISVLVDAVVAALTEKKQDVTDERKAAIVEKLKAEDYRDKALGDPLVKKHYERIKAERAAERAKEAAANAKGNDGAALAEMF